MIVRDKIDLRNRLHSFRNSRPSGRVGFVPTMGFLHDGHRSLMKAARTENECVVVSLFVNPTQFGPGEDFESYPRDEDRDFAICSNENVDYIFTPAVDVMYPPEPLTTVSVSVLTESLCGRHRPGHFHGVTTIVTKLFNIVQPDNAYFGQKDAQQVLVIKKMVEDLDFPIRVVICPTVREPDGLAMSSRNIRLSPTARKIAPVVYHALKEAQDMVRNGERDVGKILLGARSALEQYDKISVQYLDCRDRSTLKSLVYLDRPALLATAVFLDSVRLIDNVFLEPGEASL
ncbi:pantoate--beta-alanine ligase [bacterium]|nr:pantoate--beta-alanine ligase [candidate division CSSED10-310 bacterium]